MTKINIKFYLGFFTLNADSLIIININFDSCNNESSVYIDFIILIL